MARDKKEKRTVIPKTEIDEKIRIVQHPPSRIFIYLRYIGMFLIVFSIFFLFQESRSPYIVIFNMPIKNGYVGNVILSTGAVLFGIYLVNRIYRYFKT